MGTEDLFLIAVHTVEAMEEDHVFMETEVEVRCQDEIFKAKGKVVKQNGWKLLKNVSRMRMDLL